VRKDDAKPWVRAIGRRWRGCDEFRRRVEFAGGEQREEKEEERWLLRVLKDEDDVAASAASSRARPRARRVSTRAKRRDSAGRCRSPLAARPLPACPTARERPAPAAAARRPTLEAARPGPGAPSAAWWQPTPAPPRAPRLGRPQQQHPPRPSIRRRRHGREERGRAGSSSPAPAPFRFAPPPLRTRGATTPRRPPVRRLHFAGASGKLVEVHCS